jgi:MFS family permease
MSCTAILPFLTCDKLDLKYTEFAVSTQVAYNLVMLATMVPAGWLMDRFGPIRVTAWSFLMVTLYPVGLMFVNGEATLTLVVIYNALAMAGIQLAGTLAPITLARAAADAPTYVGIHLTLVGPRAILGNLAAVALYNRTDRIELPLALAAILFIGGAIMMFRLRLRPTSPAGLPSRSPGETARTSADAIP